MVSTSRSFSMSSDMKASRSLVYFQSWPEVRSIRRLKVETSLSGEEGVDDLGIAITFAQVQFE